MQITVRIQQDDRGAYLAVSPNHPECVTRGRTPKEVLDRHRVAIREHIAASGDHMPDSIEMYISQSDEPERKTR